MSQSIFSSIVPTTTSGNQLAQILNDFKDAVVSGFSGVSRPVELQAGGYWVDVTNNPTSWTVKLWTGVQDIPVFNINLVTGAASFGASDNLFEITRLSADTAGPILRFVKERIANAGQTLANDTIGSIEFFGTTDTGLNVVQARIRTISSDDVTGSAQGSIMIIEANSDSQSTLQEALRILDRKVGFGGVGLPEDTVHARGNLRADTVVDSSVGPRVNLRKMRVSTNGQVLNNDVIGRHRFLSTDQTGAEVEVAEVAVTATETHTNLAQGSKISFKHKLTGQNVFKEEMYIDNSGVVIDRLAVTNLVATNTELGTVVETEDAKLLVNKGGTQAMANAAPAGIEVEVTDGANAALAYDSALASKFKLGNVGTLKEVVTTGDTQTLTNKTLTSPDINGGTIDDSVTTGLSIQNPTRLDPKKGLESALTTYALTASNGELCWATDTKKLYKVVDGLLEEAGSGAGGGGGVRISNTFVGNGVTTSFTLTQAPQSETYLDVFIGGVYQEKTAYSVVGTSLSFSVAPPNAVNIEVIISVGTPVGGVIGLPTGGTTGQVLTKNSATDYDVSWSPVSGGGSEEYKTALALTSARTWTSRTIPVTNNWRDCAYGNGIWAAVSNNGTANRVMTSPDGVNWTSRTSAADSNWVDIIFAEGRFLAIAGGTANPNALMQSTDGITWAVVPGNNLGNSDWQGLAYSSSLDLYVTVAQSDLGAGKIATSSDGITWTTRTEPGARNWREVAFGNGVFVAVASAGVGNRVMTSSDGITWVLRASTDDTATWTGVDFSGGLFVACSANGLLMTSSDGITWVARTAPVGGPNVFQAVAAAYGMYVVAATNGAIYSTDGILWRTASTLTGTFVNVKYGGGIWVAVAGATTGSLKSSFPVGLDYE